MSKKRVPFLCTHNSARSQIAEGWLWQMPGDRFEAFSAGKEKTRVRPEAIEAMREVGADISGQEFETLDRSLEETFDHVLTVCDEANEACPIFPKAKTGCTGRSRIPRGQRARRRSGWRPSVRRGIGSGRGCGRSWRTEEGISDAWAEGAVLVHQNSA